LAARWLLNRRKEEIASIADLARNERHAEVIRFALGSLAYKESADSVDLAKDLLLGIADHDALLAGLCLLDAPHLDIPASSCRELARSIWAEGWHHFFHRPESLGRIIWTLLGRVSDSDKLLLELVVQADHERRHPMGHETILGLLACRPQREISPELCWFLRRLSAVDEDRGGPRLSPVCELLLVEAGKVPLAEHVPELTSLLRPSNRGHESRNLRDHLSGRAERVFREVGVQPEAVEAVKAQLYEIVFGESAQGNRDGAARLLLARISHLNLGYGAKMRYFRVYREDLTDFLSS
jgi:hypothetical protein